MKRIAPWAVTLVIFAVLFSKIPAEDVVARLKSAEWGKFLVLMVPYSLFFCAVDAAVVRQAVSWFNVPVRYAEVFPIRATSYILSLLHALVGQGGLAVFLHKRYAIPFWQITGTLLVLWLVEMYQLAFYSFVGAALTGELGHRVVATPYVVLASYFYFHLWFFRRMPAGHIGAAKVQRWREYIPLLLMETPSLLLAVAVYELVIFGANLSLTSFVASFPPVIVVYYAMLLWSFSRPQLLQTFYRARWWQYLVLLLMKTPNLLAAVTVYWLALPLFGVELPFTTLLTYLPLVFFTAAIPAAAKLGPSQAAWVFFFGDRVDGATLVAFSLAAHLSFQLLNALLGLCFLKRAMRELKGPVPASAVAS